MLRRLYFGSIETRPLPKHPHAIAEDPTAKRGVQEGAVGVPTTPQQPHAVVVEMAAVRYNGKVEWRLDDEKGYH